MTTIKSLPYALIMATPIGPRSKVDPNCVVVGPDSIHPDAHAQQYHPDHGPSVLGGKFEGHYTAHPVPHLTAHQAASLAYLVRCGSFTPAEVIKMAEALR